MIIPHPSLHRRGSVATILIGVAATGVIAGVFASTFSGTASSSGTGSFAGNIPKPAKPKLARRATAAELKQALARVGINPALLASVGASANITTAVVANARQYLTEHPDALTSADSNHHAAQASVDRLGLLIQQGQANEQDRTDFAAAQTSLTSAESARTAAVSGLRNGAFAALTNEQKTRADNALAHGSWRLPLRYLTTTRTDAQWISLRDAYANDRAAARTGESPDPTLQQVITEANSASSTIASNLQSGLATVRAAFEAAVNAE